MTTVERFKSLLLRLKGVERELRSFDHVHHVDVGFRYEGGRRTGGLAVRMFIHGPKRKRTKSLNVAPKRLRGLPTDVIASSFKLHCASAPDPKRVSVATKLVGGISIARDGGGAGTLGLMVRTVRAPGLFALTCNHVAGLHDRIFQPAQNESPDARFIGETFDISYADLASLVRVYEVDATERAVAGLSTVTGVVGREALIALCASRMVVCKSGRSTGVTSGQLDGLGTTGAVSIVNPADSPQPEVACEGDSGAIWMTEDGRAVAMHYAGEPWRASAQAMYLIAKNLGILFDS